MSILRRLIFRIFARKDSMRSIDDKTINALRIGSHKAFEEIFVDYYNKIKIFIMGYIKSESDAEELTEDLFVKLWENRNCLDIGESFGAYLHTMARNASINYLKHKYIRESYQKTCPIPESSFTLEDELIAKETALLIELTIEKLPEQRKKIYQLSRNEGLKNEEIALRLNTTKRNVESQLSLTLKELRQVVYTFFVLFF